MLYIIITLPYQRNVWLSESKIDPRWENNDLIRSINSIGNSKWISKLLEQFKEATRLETIIQPPRRIIFTAGIRGSPSRPPLLVFSSSSALQAENLVPLPSQLLFSWRGRTTSKPICNEEESRRRRKDCRGRIERQGDQGDIEAREIHKAVLKP